MKYYLFFDIGATNTRIAVSNDLKKFSQPLIYKTPTDYNQAINLFVKSSKDLLNNQKPNLVVGGMPGYVDPKGKLHIWRNLNFWKGKDIKHDLVNKLHAPVHIINDAALVALGEAVHGAGKNYNIIAYLTLSTGINGALIINQKIAPNTRGWEVGHQIIDFDKSHSNGNFERMVSGADLALKHGDPSQINDPKIWTEITKIITYGLNNTILHWSPEVVVLGGGLMNTLKISDIKKEVSKVLNIYPELPKIKKAKLGDIGGLYGAMQYAKDLKTSIKF